MAGDDGICGVGLITDVFPTGEDFGRLHERLAEAKRLGASIAVLPEIPLNSWVPATKERREEDCEAPSGIRARTLREAARTIGIGIVGGAIVQDQATGERRNTALVFNSSGDLVDTFCKLHIPEETGFWETSHYDAGEEAARVIRGMGVPFGVQICSDINRPEGTHALAASGAMVVINPRATEAASYDKWRHVFIANAWTSCVYLISVNRPGPDGVGMGGATIAVGPDARVLVETSDPVAVVEIDPGEIARAKRAYPGYLPVRSGLYADAWRSVTG